MIPFTCQIIKRQVSITMFRILVVEDDKGIRALMEDALTDAGYEPILACNGLEVLDVLEKSILI